MQDSPSTRASVTDTPVRVIIVTGLGAWLDGTSIISGGNHAIYAGSTAGPLDRLSVSTLASTRLRHARCDSDSVSHYYSASRHGLPFSLFLFLFPLTIFIRRLFFFSFLPPNFFQ
jgi:hypothetical protein